MQSRRRFLAGVGAGIAAAASGVGLRPGYASGRGFKILEIYCFGGAFRWNAIRDPDLAFATGTAPFDLSATTPDWASIGGSDAWAPPTTEPWAYGPFALGPAAWPMGGLGGPSLLDRTRLLAMSHDLNAHEVAEPLVLTGDRPGRATAKGLGAMVNRLYDDGLCHSVVLDCVGAVIPRRAASSVGILGLDYRPHVFPVPTAEMYGLLDRTGLTGMDALRTAMMTEYGAGLVHPALGGRVRSKGFDAYEAAWSDLAAHETLKSTLSEAQVAAASAASTGWADSAPARAVQLGVELLRGTSGVPVHCVTILDGSASLSYDTHSNTGDTQDGGFWAVMRALAIAHAAQPLDDIIVYIHSEFGRLDLDGEHTGSEHWCFGYNNLLIGGPAQSGALVGRFGTSTGGLPVGSAECWSPTDLYGALLWAVQPPGAQRDPFTEAFSDDAEEIPLLDAGLKGLAGIDAGSPEAVAEALFGGEA